MSEAYTTVILEGPMGRHFGRKWKLKAKSPAEALRLINANKPGFFNWIRNNLGKYANYRVIVDKEDRDSDSFSMQCDAKCIRFVPLVSGAGAAARFVVGAVMVVAAFYTAGATLAALSTMSGLQAGMMSMGASLMLGAASELLASKPKPQKNEMKREDKTSYYFSGPVNTEMQGVGIPLIYGTVMTGSHAISAAMTIN